MKLKEIILILATITVLLLNSPLLLAKQIINFWYENPAPKHQKLFKDVVDKYYNSIKDKYKIKIQFHADVTRDVKLALLSGTAPDIILLTSPVEIAMLAKNNKLLAIDKYVNKYHWDELLRASILETGKYKGKLYGIATSLETLGVFYNLDTLKENSLKVPHTFKELDEFVKISKDNNLMSLAVGNSGWKPANEWIVSSFLNNYAGSDNVYQALKGELAWSSPIFIEAMKKLNEYFQQQYLANGNNYFSLSGDQPIVLLKNKKASSVYVGSWGFQWIKQHFGESPRNIEWSAFPTRTLTRKSDIYPIGIGAVIVVNGSTKFPDEVADFLNFIITNKNFYKIMNQKWPGTWNIPLKNPSINEVAMYEPYKKSLIKLNDALNNGNYGFTTWSFFPPVTRQAFIDDIEKVWLKKISVEKMMKNIDKKFKKELKEGLVPNIPNPSE